MSTTYTSLLSLPDLDSLANQLQVTRRVDDRLQLLHGLPQVREFISARPAVRGLLHLCTPYEEAAALQIMAIGQGEIVFQLPVEKSLTEERWKRLLGHLAVADKFYDSIGGLAGYQATFVRILNARQNEQQVRFWEPPGIDICDSSESVRRAIRAGIDGLPQMAEIYPVGGAGDRLDLIHEVTGEPLPAACLRFAGRSLLDGLLRDLQAREYLYEKIHGKRVITPVVLMTSADKNNSDHIQAICEECEWYGRPRDSLFIFAQCSVPVITESGLWAMQEPLVLRLKPGGHGALWKLMEDKGAFDWLADHKRSKALVRQINNPIAGTDYGLLAFTGIGLVHDKQFGFAACHRAVGAAEGVDVLFERQIGDRFEYGISNIEYTDFNKYGISDAPSSPGSSYSKFPSNTNILFADLVAVRERAKENPLPGVLLNFKHETTYLDATGAVQRARASRLESTMQNVADAMVTSTDKPASSLDKLGLPTYVTFNHRHKTISVTKNGYKPGKSLRETPDGCYLDTMRNYRELLTLYCQMELPELSTEEEYLEHGPSFHCELHPAIGPLYDVIAQKIRGGRIAYGSELSLDLAEVDCEGLHLEGSLIVHAAQPLKGGSLILKDVHIANRGIDRQATNRYWSGDIHRLEAMEILFEGEGEFVAEGIVFLGPLKIVVPEGLRLIAESQGGEILYRQEPLLKPKHWHYQYLDDDSIKLNTVQG